MKKKKDTPVSSTNKIDCHNITEILLKVVLNTLILLLLTVFILHLLVSFYFFFYLRPSLLSLCILTAPILSLSVSSDRGSWNHIALTIKHIKIFSINFTLSRILTADNLNDLRVKFLYWVQKPVGHFVFFASSKTFSLLTSISSKLEWIFPKKKKITNQLL